MAVVNAIMLGITGIFSIPLLKDFFPSSAAKTTFVTIVPGQYNPDFLNGTNQVGGPAPNLALFDANGNRIGFKSGVGHGKLKSGRAMTIAVVPSDEDNNIPPEYLSISASGPDALCIAWVALTGPNDEHWTWNGEIGKACGQPWYPSVQPMGTSNVRPSCIWFSNDGRFPKGIGLHMINFQKADSNQAVYRANQYAKDNDMLCKSKPRQHFYTDNYFTELTCLPVFSPIPDIDADGTDSDPSQSLTDGVFRCDPQPGVQPTIQQLNSLRKATSAGKLPSVFTYGIRRDLVEVSERSDALIKSDCDYKHVVISEINEHSATELCQSPTSSGPDFVSTKESLLCDMCTHQLWPLCSKAVLSHCFDPDTLELRSGQVLSLRADGAETFHPEKLYEGRVDWT